MKKKKIYLNFTQERKSNKEENSIAVVRSVKWHRKAKNSRKGNFSGARNFLLAFKTLN
jgi:hypothetical protein